VVDYAGQSAKKRAVMLIEDGHPIETKEHAKATSPRTTNAHLTASPSTQASEDKRLAYANLQYTIFQLEKAIAKLKSESDGSSKSIPDFLAVLGTLRSCTPKLAP
jgi:hypothetical protein